MTTTPARPYTDDDVHDEAVLLGVALSRPPTVADLERSLPGQYIPSRRADDGTGPTYGDLLDADGITALARAVHDRVTGAPERVFAVDTTPARDTEQPTVADTEAPLRFALVAAGLAREDADDAIWEHTTAVQRAQAAEVRAAALTEAADHAARVARRLDEQHHDERAQGAWDVENTLRAELRRMAAAARPDCAVCHQPADGHPAVCFPPAARPDDTRGA